MKKIVFVAGLLISSVSWAADGVVSLASQHSVAVTADKLEQVLGQKGMTVFARINHAAGARQQNLSLNDSELVIFGNPKVGTPLMQCQPGIALDLPQKALIWQDNQQKVWLSYNRPHYLKQRHRVEGCDQLFLKVEKALAGIAKAATE